MSHKGMLQPITRPRILLLAGAIEFERLDTPRLSSLDTLLEQEGAYLQLLVSKIVTLQPGTVAVSVSLRLLLPPVAFRFTASMRLQT